jgi:Leucine-rich repeat (LRR) protein
MSFNWLGYTYIPQLALIPCLMKLDLSFNELEELPESLQHFSLLKQLNLEGNNFRSDYKASNFWASLATLPRIESISVARNQIRGIHTEKLAAGNFSTLIELDFSYNIVENQHNLICSRNFVSLKKLYITGNPFALNNQYKGL